MAFAQAAAQDAQGTEIAARLSKIHRAWGPAANSPGASLSLVELSRSGPIIKYRLYAKGLPREKTYALLSWPVTQAAPSENLQGVTLDESGQAICAGKPGTCGSAEKPDDPIDLATSPVKGEPFRIGLVSTEDKSLRAFAKIVPLPNQGADKGCVIDAVLLMPAGEIVEIEGAGFQPGETLQMESHSGKERHGGKGKAEPDGTVAITLLPYVKGGQRGTTHVQLKAAKCSPELDFDWGKRP